MSKKDYYEVLEVQKSADAAEIKKAYLKQNTLVLDFLLVKSQVITAISNMFSVLRNKH
jgi:hypothetical protein